MLSKLEKIKKINTKIKIDSSSTTEHFIRKNLSEEHESEIEQIIDDDADEEVVE